MAIFKRQKSEISASELSGRNSIKRHEAQLLLLVKSASSSRELVLGLNWRMIMLSGGTEAAMKLARDAGATHYCMVGGQTVGYGVLPGKKGKSLPDQTAPAALLAARHYFGDGLYALSLSDKEIWVVQTRSGRPIGQDQVLIDNNGNVAKKAKQWLAERLAITSESTIYTDIDVTSMGANSREFSLSTLMTVSIVPADKLRAVLTETWTLKNSISKRVWKIAAVITLGWIAVATYDYWNESVKAERHAKNAADEKQAEDPKKVWQDAILQLASGRIQPASESLLPLRQSLGKLPVSWEGWKLTNAVCNPKPVALGKQTWTCIANYEVGESKKVGTNRELNLTIPEGYTAQFKPTQSVSLGWSVVRQVEPLKISLLPTRASHMVETASKLQELMPALTNTPSFSFTTIPVAPPRSADGKEIAIPTGVHIDIPSEATINLRGPLRTFDALMSRGIDADWRAIKLTYDSIGADEVKVKTSSLQIELIGNIYAKD
jgi:hypothetical protein